MGKPGLLSSTLALLAAFNIRHGLWSQMLGNSSQNFGIMDRVLMSLKGELCYNFNSDWHVSAMVFFAAHIIKLNLSKEQ
jgi:hypothetical protein